MQRVLLRSTHRAAHTLQHIRTMASAPITAPKGTIALSDTEEKFVTLLDEFATGYNPPIECRIAGGWVRDKVSCFLWWELANNSCSPCLAMTWTLRCRRHRATHSRKRFTTS